MTTSFEQCLNGHFFDSARNASCPFCMAAPKQADKQDSVTEVSEPSFDPPVGWLTVIDGPMVGTDFTIRSGTNTIGRSRDSTVALSSDLSVEQLEHALLVYDSRSNSFFVRPGSGRCSVNGEPIARTIPLQAGDKLLIGATPMVFISLAGDRFHWDKVVEDQNQPS